MKQIKILLAEDHLVVREGFRRLLDEEEDFSIVGEAKTGRMAVELSASLRPDVVVMDIAMPLLNGLVACSQLLKASPETRVLMLSAHGEDAYVERAIESGASGFVLKHTSIEDLAKAIRSVHAGKRVFSAEIVQRYRSISLINRSDHVVGKRESLTSRELEVLQLIAEGKANKETADELGISIKTVEKHRANLMRKLNIHDTASLTRYAISAGIVESSIQMTTQTT